MGYKVTKQNGETEAYVAELIADTVADLPNINVNNYAAGSSCLVIATQDVYILNTQKQWVVL